MNSKLLNKEMLKKNKTAIMIFIPIFLVIIVLFAQTRYKLVFQTDYSVNFSCGFLDRHYKQPEKGEYFAFVFNAVRNQRYGKSFVKKVACVSGEWLTHKGRNFYCNSEFLGTAKEFDKDGKRAPLFDFNGIIPERHFFAMGETKDSYDSRYWGFVDHNWVLGRVRSFI